MQQKKNKSKRRGASKVSGRGAQGPSIGKVSQPSSVAGRRSFTGGPMSAAYCDVPQNLAFSIGREFTSSAFSGQGKVGLKLVGRVPIASVSNNGTTFSGQGCLSEFLTSATQNVGIALHPNTIFAVGTQEYAEAQNYTRYKFRKLRLVYTTTAAANQGRSCLISFYGDGAIVGGTPPAITSAGFLPGASVFATWVPVRIMDFTKYLDLEDWFYVDIDNANLDASNRQCFQGAILGYWLNSGAAVLIDGTLWIEYELDLVESRPVLDIALLQSESKVQTRKHHPGFRVRSVVQCARNLGEIPQDEAKDREPIIDDDRILAVPKVPVPRRESGRPAASERSSSTDRKSVSR